MLRLFCLISLMVFFGQINSNLNVGKTFINSNNNAWYVIRYVGVTIQEGKPVQDGAADCLVSELMASGIFSDVKVNYSENENRNYIEAHIDVNYVQNLDQYYIKEIIFEHMPESFDKNQFLDYLKKHGIKPGVNFIKAFNNPSNNIFKVTQKAVDHVKPKNINENFVLPWITIRTTNDNGINLIFSDVYHGPCERFF